MADGIVYLSYTRRGKQKYRAYRYYNGEALTTVSIEDNVSPYLAHLAAKMPERVNKALSSIGYHLHKALKQAVKDGGPRGERWPEVAGIQSRPRRGARGVELYYSRRPQHRRPFGKLGNTLGYYNDAARRAVSVGWLSLAAARRGEQLQRGWTVQATRKQRWLFTASARWDKQRELLRSGSIFPMLKSSFTVPGRNLIAPVYEQEQPRLRPLLESKLAQYMRRDEAWFAKTARNAVKAIKR